MFKKFFFLKLIVNNNKDINNLFILINLIAFFKFWNSYNDNRGFNKGFYIQS